MNTTVFSPLQFQKWTLPVDPIQKYDSKDTKNVCGYTVEIRN